MSKGRKRNSQPNPKEQQIAELQEQLSQALEIIQKQQKRERRAVATAEEKEMLKRIGKRQAAPFARRHWVEQPRRPGRKAGKGKICSSRTAQRFEDQRDEGSQTARLSGVWRQAAPEVRKQEQFVTDIPVVEVKTTRFVTYSGYCGAMSEASALAASRTDLAGDGCGRGDGGTACQSAGR